MKILILSLAFCICFSSVQAQEETSEYKSAILSLQESFNQEDYEAIFSIFSEEMKQALPLPNTISFFKGLRAQAGEIKANAFIAYERQGTASYKTTFENGIFNLLLSLNKQKEITGLLLKPYQEPSKKNEDLKNNLFSENGSITAEQSEIIFSKISTYPDNTQIAIAIIKDGEVSYFGAKREKDTFNEVPNSVKVFEIGSITKVFTSTLLANLVINKQVKLDDPINKYLDFNINGDQTISFLSLANHTSGLPRLPSNLNLYLADPKNPYAAYDKGKLESYLKDSLQTNDTSETEYEYSNLGAGLLAYIIGEIENKSFEEMLQERIFTKYKMNQSSTDINKFKNDLVKGLDPEGNETSNWDLSALKGAGAILSTVQDLAQFAKAQFESKNEALSLTQKSTSNAFPNMDMGLGWHIIKDKNYLFHNGGTGGYTSSIVLDLAEKNGVIILSNVSAFHPDMSKIDQLSMELIDGLR